MSDAAVTAGYRAQGADEAAALVRDQCIHLPEPEKPAAFGPPFDRFAHAGLREALSKPRLERAIGVVYRPDTEYSSHYFEAVLPEQFDAFVWFEETRAVTPLRAGKPHGAPDTYPFGL